MSLVQPLSYEQVPYPSLSHYSTHPDGLATMAILAGMQPAPIEHCRVLELGCADGGNLMPMAYGLPNSEFVGIDLSEKQVALGQERLKSVGLANVKLKRLDILEVGPQFGTFDYILAHGVYSWVPEQVQEKILSLCRELLAPEGVAYISYNTYPGWHLINIVRDLMRFHTRGIGDPLEKVAAARETLRFFAESYGTELDAYSSFLKLYSDFIDGRLEDQTPKFDSALLHDELEELNQPCYFYQFIDRARAHGLQYLNDLHQMDRSTTRPEILEALRKRTDDLVELEQSVDFLQNRTFRRTLLVQGEAALNRRVQPGKAREFFLASHATVQDNAPALKTKAVAKFQGKDNAVLSIDHPLSKAAMLCLADDWPQTFSFDQLMTAAWARLGQDPARIGKEQTHVDAQVLGMNLLKAFSYSTSLVELHAYPVPLVARPGLHPLASRTARFQSILGDSVTNLRHERVTVDGFDRFLLPLLDGSRDRQDLMECLVNGPVAEGMLTVEKDGQPLDPSGQGESLGQELDHRLDWLAQAALFVDPARIGEDAYGNRQSH